MDNINFKSWPPNHTKLKAYFEHSYEQKTGLVHQFNDIVLLKLIQEYMTTIYDDSYDTEQIKRCFVILCEIFSPLSLEEVNYSFFINNFDKWNKLFYRGHIMRFVVYLCENEIIPHSPLDRLITFKDRIGSATNADFYEYILLDTEENYRAFLESSLYEKRNTDQVICTIYKFRVNMSFIHSEKIKKSIDDFIRELKFNNSYDSLSNQMDSLNKFRDIMTIIQNDIGHMDFSAHELLYLFEKNKKKSPKINSIRNHIVLNLANHLVRDEIINDPNIIALEQLSPDFGNKFFKYIKIILTAEHPERILITERHGGFKQIINFDIESDLVRKMMIQFAKDFKHFERYMNMYCKVFDESVKPFTVTTPDEFSFATFERQIEFFKNMNNVNSQRFITITASFYYFITMNYNPSVFGDKGLPPDIVNNRVFAKNLCNGYKITFYNPNESVPEYDKWIFICRNDEVVENNLFDFTQVKCKLYRIWLKEVVWDAASSYTLKKTLVFKLMPILNYLYDIKTDKNKKIMNSPNHKIDEFSIFDFRAIRNYIISQKQTEGNINMLLLNVRTYFKYVNDHHVFIEPASFKWLAGVSVSAQNNANAIPDDELRILSTVVQNESNQNINNKIFKSIFFLALATNFRGKEIFRLQKDCVQQTVKKNEYIVVLKRKTSHNEYIEQPITVYVKRELDEVLNYTKKFRERCPDPDLSQKMFLIETKGRRGMIRQVKYADFNNFLKKCCRIAGFDHVYTISNLRDTFMTLTKEQAIRKKLSDLDLSALTGHKNPETDDKFYVDYDIKTMLSAANQVIIGDVDIKGRILKKAPKEISKTENLVEHECGYCSSDSCNFIPELPCLLCESFVATIDRIDRFKEHIRTIDHFITKSESKHDKEDLNTIKRLYLAYLAKLIETKETENKEFVS